MCLDFLYQFLSNLAFPQRVTVIYYNTILFFNLLIM